MVWNRDDHTSHDADDGIRVISGSIYEGTANMSSFDKKKEQDMTMHLTDHFSTEDIEIMKQLVQDAKDTTDTPVYGDRLRVVRMSDVKACMLNDFQGLIDDYDPNYPEKMYEDIEDILDRYLCA